MRKGSGKYKQLLFGFDDAESERATPEILGGKGYGLLAMHRAGFPVPVAKIISTELCAEYIRNPAGVRAYLAQEAIPAIVASMNVRHQGLLPLLSVRSGAKESMPGMMDTVLNVGLTRENLGGWERIIGVRSARDCRRRLMQMYGSIVCGIAPHAFESVLEGIKTKKRASEDQELDEADLLDVIAAYEKVYKKEGAVLPESVGEQILGASEAVLRSWGNLRAVEYRKIRGIKDADGTAIVYQQMVFGNKDERSCSGVLFTRHPALGVNEPFGDFLVNAQGEDVVNGTRTPEPIYKMKIWNRTIYDQLVTIGERLEQAARDVQDVEFTVESGELYLLQARTAQRSALAAVKCAVEMAKSGLISKAEALERVSLAQYDQLCKPMIAPTFNVKADTVGLAASVGVVTGRVVFSSEHAVAAGDSCILLAEETKPEDLPGMHAAKGILTRSGGVTSHAAVVARGLDKVCVVGAEDIQFKLDHAGRIVAAKIGSHTLKEGALITLDGATGRVWVGGSVPVVPGRDLPALLDFNDLIYEVFPIYRIVTDGRDLNVDLPMVYATYELDTLPDAKIKAELRDSLPYLKGILDLSTMEEHAPEADEEILGLGGSAKDDAAFKTKANCVLEFSGDKNQFKVYLGKRAKEFRELFERHGFATIEPGGLGHLKRNESVFSILKGDSPEIAAVMSAIAAGHSKAVAAVGKARPELLHELAEKKKAGESVVPVIAMSVPQILSSIKKR